MKIFDHANGIASREEDNFFQAKYSVYMLSLHYTIYKYNTHIEIIVKHYL